MLITREITVKGKCLQHKRTSSISLEYSIQQQSLGNRIHDDGSFHRAQQINNSCLVCHTLHFTISIAFLYPELNFRLHVCRVKSRRWIPISHECFRKVCYCLCLHAFFIDKPSEDIVLIGMPEWALECPPPRKLFTELINEVDYEQ